MKLKELFYTLPENLIAQKAAKPAHKANLMIIETKKNKKTSDVFFNIDKYLKKDDILVFNNSKVLPARLIGNKDTGGKVEILLLKQLSPNHWEALVKGGSKLIGKKINITKNFFCFVEMQNSDTFVVHFNISDKNLTRSILKYGHIPTPPYIHRLVPNSEYQNIFADNKKLGSAAAPTAGLHFTKKVLEKLKRKGVKILYITLHVGLGTFQPVKSEVVENHNIHSEYYEVDKKSLQRLQIAKKDGKNIIAVGTTSCRVLETIKDIIKNKDIKHDISGETNIFIYPGYKFEIIDGLITNFHTPYSSLLALVYAFGGKKVIKEVYQMAIKEKWRFFSLGDGMYIKK